MTDANVKAAGQDLLNRWSAQSFERFRVPFLRVTLGAVYGAEALAAFDAELAAATTPAEEQTVLTAAAEVLIRLNT